MNHSPSSFPDFTIPGLALFAALNGCSPIEPAPEPGEVRLAVGSLNPVTQEPAVAACVAAASSDLELDTCLSQVWGSTLSNCDQGAQQPTNRCIFIFEPVF